MKIIISKKYRKYSQFRGPVGMDNPRSDDLGLSPEMADPANLEDGGGYVDPEEDNARIIRSKGTGFYYSITNDYPEGPFKSSRQALDNASEHIKRTSESIDDEKYWLSHIQFYSYDGEQIESLGDFMNVDPSLMADTTPYYTARGHDPQGLMSE